jgi:hypothetical protein
VVEDFQSDGRMLFDETGKERESGEVCGTEGVLKISSGELWMCIW